MHSQARLVALAETSPERGRDAAERYQIPALVSDYRELLRRPDIQVVSVALPNYLHAPVGLEVLKAGKHLLMEKPMATCSADAASLVALAKRKRRVFMVGQNLRFMEIPQTLKQLIDKGALGELYHIDARWLRRSGIPRIGSWFTRKEFAGGGCLYDVGVHALDLALYLMGEFDVAAVSGQTFSKFGQRGLGEGKWGRSEVDPTKPFDVDDFAVAMLKLRSGRTISLQCTWAAFHEKDSSGLQIYGTEGGASSNPAQIYRKGLTDFITEPITPLPPIHSTNRMVHFIDCVLGRTKPLVKMSESLMIQRVLDAIYRSATTGREIRLRH